MKPVLIADPEALTSGEYLNQRTANKMIDRGVGSL
jgi:hypothetical protein